MLIRCHSLYSFTLINVNSRIYSAIINVKLRVFLKDEVPEFKMSEDTYLDAKQTPEYVVEETQAASKRQFKTAEIADAVMGTELPANSAGLESLIPSPGDPMAGFTGHCGEETCVRETPEDTSELDIRENEEPLILEMIHTDTSAAEDQNSTETAKTYKVNCDKRNITGMVNFTIQVLNASQVLLPLL